MVGRGRRPDLQSLEVTAGRIRGVWRGAAGLDGENREGVCAYIPGLLNAKAPTSHFYSLSPECLKTQGWPATGPPHIPADVQVETRYSESD